MHIHLLILKTQQLDRLRTFYEQLGLCFIKEKHDCGPEHYSCTLGNIVLELYPTIREATDVSFGITVSDLDRAVSKFRSISAVYKLPYATENGIQAIIKDPDGRLVFITQPQS